MYAASGFSEQGSERPSIAIVGAGIGGMTLGALLARAGASVRIYEQAAAFARVGTGIQMGPNAMKILRDLGVAEALAPVSYSPGYLGNREWDTGDRTFDLPVGADAEERYGAPYYLLHRGDLHAVLHGAVPPDIIELDSRLVGIEQNGGRVRLDFEGKPAVYADLVIGLTVCTPSFVSRYSLRTTRNTQARSRIALYSQHRWYRERSLSPPPNGGESIATSSFTT